MGRLFKHCPGVRKLIQPSIILITCPVCGEEVEFFEDEIEAECPGCGRIIRREPSAVCVTWCKYARECIASLREKGLITEEKARELEKIARRGGGS